MHQLTAPLGFLDGSIAPAAGNGQILLGSRLQHLDEGTNAGTVAGTTVQIAHISGVRTTRVRFAFANWYMSNQSTEADNGNAIFVRAGVIIAGTFYKLTFSGNAEVSIAGGGMVWSDWLYITGTALLKGATFYTRTYTRVAVANQLIPKGIVPYISAGEWIASGDYTTSITAPAAGAQTDGSYQYGPVMGQAWGRLQPSFAIFGDSIPTGAGDGAGHDYGYVTRALAGNYGAVNLAKGNASISDISTSGKRLALAHYADYALVAIGTNDLNSVQSFSTIQGRYVPLFAALAAQRCKVIVVTVPPKANQTTSGSDWGLGNQVKYNANYDAGGSWEQTNAWLKSLPANVFACIDLNEVWAYGIGYWQWHSSRVSDPLHPNTAGHDAARDYLLDFFKRGGLQSPLVQNPLARAVKVVNTAVANSTTTLADLTELSLTVRAGAKYRIHVNLDHTAAATTTGLRLAFTGPASPTQFHMMNFVSSSTTAVLWQPGLTTYTAMTATASSASTGSSRARLEVNFTPSADGTLTLQFASEVASSAISILPGSWMEVERIY